MKMKYNKKSSSPVVLRLNLAWTFSLTRYTRFEAHHCQRSTRAADEPDFDLYAAGYRRRRAGGDQGDIV